MKRRSLSLILASATIFGGISTISSGVAIAEQCGHFVSYEKEEGGINIPVLDIPVLPVKTEHAVANYNHCGNENAKIRVESANGTSEKCVEPGVTRLGYVNEDARIKGSHYIGSC